jgi:hypothetical protein
MENVQCGDLCGVSKGNKVEVMGFGILAVHNISSQIKSSRNYRTLTE